MTQPDSASKTCILIPTFSGYVPVALVTRRLVARYWPGHPSVFFAGTSEPFTEDHWLPLRSDVRDWCSIVADACRDLIEHGYTSAYLLLDDHPPLNPCNEQHLNTTLPSLLRDLDATYIGLNGWGYGRAGRVVTGQVLKRSSWNLEHVHRNFSWKLSLHPGLWNIKHLLGLAEGVKDRTAVDNRSAWIFERMVNKITLEDSLDYADRCYRVCGPRMTSSKVRYLRYRLAWLLLTTVARAKGRFSNNGELDAMATAVGYYYEGPYPLFWSGVIVQGRINSLLNKYITACRRDLVDLIPGELPNTFTTGPR